MNLHLFIKLANELSKVIDKESHQSYMKKIGQMVNTLMSKHTQDITSKQGWEIGQTVVLLVLTLFGIVRPNLLPRPQNQTVTQTSSQQQPPTRNDQTGQEGAMELQQVAPPPSGQQLQIVQ